MKVMNINSIGYIFRYLVNKVMCATLRHFLNYCNRDYL